MFCCSLCFKKTRGVSFIFYFLKKSENLFLEKLLFENTWASTITAAVRPRLAAQLGARDFFCDFLLFYCNSPFVERWDLEFGSNTTDLIWSNTTEKFEISRDEAKK